MIGQFDTWNGGLNLVGDPQKRSEFSLSQAAAMSNCDFTTGVLRPGYGLVAADTAVLPILSAWWHSKSGTWWKADTRRSYAVFGEYVMFSQDGAGLPPQEVRPEEDTVEGLIGVAPLTSDELTQIQLGAALWYRLPIERMIEGPIGHIGEPNTTVRLFAVLQDVKITSTNPITNIRAGTRITINGTSGSSRVRDVAKYEYDHTIPEYRVHCTVSLGSTSASQLRPLTDGDVLSLFEDGAVFPFESAALVESAAGTRDGVSIVGEEVDLEKNEVAGENVLRRVAFPFDVLWAERWVNGLKTATDYCGMVSRKVSSVNQLLAAGMYRYVFTLVDEFGRESATQVPQAEPVRKEFDNFGDPGSMAVELSHTYVPKALVFQGAAHNTRHEHQFRSEFEREGRPATTVEAPGTEGDPQLSQISPRYIRVSNIRQHYHRNIRVYRTLADGSTYFFLREIENEPQELMVDFIDTTSDWVLAGNPQLNAADNHQPLWRSPRTEVWEQVNGQYLTPHRGRFFLAFENRIYFSRAGMAHAWPTQSWLQVPDTITGLCSVFGELLIFTGAATWRLGGYDERTFDLVRIPSEQGCVAHASIAMTGPNPVWVSRDGVCTYDGQFVLLLTGSTLGKGIGWHLVTAAVGGDNVYHAFFADGTWLTLDFARKLSATTTTLAGTPICAARQDTTDLAFVVIDRTLFSIHAQDSASEFSFLTGKDEGEAPGVLKSFSKIWVQGTGKVRVKVLIDGKQVADYTFDLTDGAASRFLPGDVDLRGYAIQLDLSGTGTLSLVRWEGQPLAVA